MKSPADKVSRCIKKVFGTELGRRVETEPGKASEADIQVILAKLPELLAAMEAVLLQADAKVQLANRSLEISSRELFEANNSLSGTNNQVRAILDLMDQAILVFGRDGICLPVYSRSCSSVIGESPEGKSVAEILRLSSKDKQAFGDWLRLLFEGASSHEILLNLLPSRLPSEDGRRVDIEFRPVRDADGLVSQVMMIATDRSDELLKAAQIELEHNLGQRIISVVSNRTGFQSFLAMVDRAKDAILSIDPAGASDVHLTECKLVLHGLKALAGSFFADSVQKLLHQFENELGLNGPAFFEARKERAEELEACVRKFRNEIEELLGPDFMRFTEYRGVRISDIQRFRDLLEAAPGSSELLIQFDDLISNVRLKTFCRRYASMAENVARALGKRILPLEAEIEGDIRVNIAPLDRFLTALSHLISNAIDHGIESPEDRILFRKPEQGRLRFRVEERMEGARRYLVFRISDDGRGISIEEIGKRAGVPLVMEALTSDQLLDLLLKGVSTKARPDEYSGRGVGIKALYHEVKSLKGAMTVRTENGKGTVFEIVIPA